MTEAAPTYSYEQLKACAERELKLRRAVYSKWVREGRYSVHRARLEIEMMEAIVNHFASLVDEPKPQELDL